MALGLGAEEGFLWSFNISVYYKTHNMRLAILTSLSNLDFKWR